MISQLINPTALAAGALGLSLTVNLYLHNQTAQLKEEMAIAEQFNRELNTNLDICLESNVENANRMKVQSATLAEANKSLSKVLQEINTDVLPNEAHDSDCNVPSDFLDRLRQCYFSESADSISGNCDLSKPEVRPDSGSNP